MPIPSNHQSKSKYINEDFCGLNQHTLSTTYHSQPISHYCHYHRQARYLYRHKFRDYQPCCPLAYLLYYNCKVSANSQYGWHWRTNHCPTCRSNTLYIIGLLSSRAGTPMAVICAWLALCRTWGSIDNIRRYWTPSLARTINTRWLS